MKKILSLCLVAVLLLSTVATVTAAQVSTTFSEKDSFYFSFERESDFLDPRVKLDEIGDTAYASPDLTGRYIPGANGSKGAVGIRAAVTENSPQGNVSQGLAGLSLTPGKAYELTMDYKLFSGENLSAVPNLQMFFFAQKSDMYIDEACTQKASSGETYAVVTINGSDFDFTGKDWVKGDWGSLQKIITVPTVFENTTYYTKPGDLVSMRVFFRIGKNMHALNNKADFTESFYNSCETFEKNGTTYRKLWIEYGLDNIGMRPASQEMVEVPRYPDALWYNSFEDNSWDCENEGVITQISHSNTALVNDVPEALKNDSTKSIHATYTGNTSGTPYVDFYQQVSDNNKKVWHNRVYEISFWAKFSPAVVDYHKAKKTKLSIIPERADKNRLDRNMSKWQRLDFSDSPTTEWKKYTYYYYEDMPMALGRDGENENRLTFRVRNYNVPKGTENNLTATVNGEAVSYIFNSGSNYYKIEDFQCWYDEFVVTPLDIVYNGDFHKPQDTETVGTLWYHGADGTVTLSATDALSANVFHNGTITEENGKKVLLVTENGGAPYQSVDIENGKEYTVTFQAKAKDTNSVGKPLNVMLDRSVTGDIFYLYSGNVEAGYREPGTLTLKGSEAQVEDEFYKNTQGETPTAFLYQYYSNGEWVGTNDLTKVAPSDTLTADWKTYTYSYKWNYEGKHYRMPKLVFSDNANYELADIAIREVKDDTQEETVSFKIENLTATGKDYLSSADKITLTWDFVSTGSVPTEESEGAIVKVYEKTTNGLAFIGATVSEKAGQAQVEATEDLFGKILVFEVIPKDKNGLFGTGAKVDFFGVVALTVDGDLQMGTDHKSVDWNVSMRSDNREGRTFAHVAMYSKENMLVNATDISFDYANGEIIKNGTIPVTDSVEKVKLFVWDQTFAPLAGVTQLDLFPVNNNPFSGDTDINIVYLGDSIYEGSGASKPSERWVNQVHTWFETKFKTEGVTVTPHYMGMGGTTTENSLVRIERDVIAHNPDLVFISASCNDGIRDTRRNMESMVRTLQNLENPPYIVFTRTTNRNYSASQGFVEQVAEFYKLPVIDDLEAFKAATAEGKANIADLFIGDGVHPTNAGYDVITEEIISCMETGRYYERGVKRTDKLLENSGIIENTRWFTPVDESVTMGGTWTEGTTNNGTMYESNAAGDSLSFTFTGEILAFEYGYHSQALDIEVWVDGVKRLTCNPRYSDTVNNHKRILKENSVLFDLEDKEHTVVIKTVATSAVTGTPSTAIYRLMTGSWK